MSPDMLPDRAGSSPIRGSFKGASLSPTPEEVAALIAEVEAEEWFGVYMNGEKVGFSRLVSRPSRADEPPGYLVALDEVTRSSADGVVDVHQDERAWWYENSQPFALRSLVTREVSGAGEIVRRFEFTDQGGELTTVVDGSAPSKRELGPTLETVDNSLGIEPELVEVGQHAAGPSFDDVLLRDVEWQTTVTAKQTRQVSGVALPVAVLENYAPHDKSKYSAETTHAGRLLRVSMGEGFVMEAEPKERATQGVGSMDAVHDGVPVADPLGDPTTIKALTLVLSTGQGFAPPDGPNQKVTRVGEGRYRMEITAAPGAEVLPDEREEALAPSASVDSDHPEVKRMAARIVGSFKSTPTDAERLAALVDYVDRIVRDSYDANFGTASQVLAHRAGDCSEHTLLLVALARAAGLPARELSGLVYASDFEQRFVWHAWAEVAVDGRWWAVDPTFGEVPADATHIKLGSDRDARWVAYGKLAIEIIDRR